ncbi:MAG: threonine--tRNA ligase [Planctomycetota bacterium]
MSTASPTQVCVRLPDGKEVSHPASDTPLDVARGISEGLARAVVAAKVGDKIVDSFRSLGELSGDIRSSDTTAASGQPASLDLVLVTNRDAVALDVLRHSAAHVMARAVMRLFDGVSLAFGPTTDGGFYYDFDLEHRLTEDDFPKIEAEMKQIIKAKEPFERFSLPRDEAIKLCDDLAQDLKVEHIETGLADQASLSFYRQGEFVDLCRGPHIPDAGKIKAIKLMSVAGSHWKGDVSNRSLQRLYGTAFFDKKELNVYLEQLEEAKRRDHRVLGKQHNLFAVSPDVGQGLCLWLPKGARVRIELEDFLRREMMDRGYEPVFTPQIGRVEMYETSGHFPYYRDSQFPPMFGSEVGGMIDAWQERLAEGALSRADEDKIIDAIGVFGVSIPDYRTDATADAKIEKLKQWQSTQDRYLLRPMNCPHHCNIFKSQARSYRQLPLRLFEFGSVFRHEQTGELNGLLRVRGFTQDDAHIFCTDDQVEDEFRSTIELTQFVLESVGLTDYRVQLSLRDPKSDKYVGNDENWKNSEASLRRVLEQTGLDFGEEEGEAAFYGPKADFMVRDCIGRMWQLGTVQLDYNLPERFDLEYNGADNTPHRPVMIHRAPFGSLERFTGMLIEHFAGAFPMWLSPEQIRVLPLSDKSYDYAIQVTKRLADAGLKATVDTSDGKVQAKIRTAQLDLVNYMAVVGPKEAESDSVALRDRIDGDLGSMPIVQAIEKLQAEIRTRQVRQAVKAGSVASLH